MALISVKQAAVRLGVSVGTVYGLCAARRIRFSRVGLGRGKIMISEEAVQEYLKATESGPGPVKAPAAPRPRVKLEHLRL
jgi:excisionase family DNA binding protein